MQAGEAVGEPRCLRGRGEFAVRPIALCVMLACAELSLAAAPPPNPTGPTKVSGTIDFAGLGTTNLTVTNSPGSIIHWQGFSIPNGSTTHFAQQSAASAVLNRVVGGDLSAIHGTLSSNGRVFLINPAGILIGPTGVVDTAGFVASTLDMSNADFWAGKLRFSGDSSAGSITNQGLIKARFGGNVVLVAPQIENAANAIIESHGGDLILAAGRRMTIASPRLDGIQFEVQAPGDSVLNVGRLIAEGGAVGAFAGSLKHSGEIRATALARNDAGQVVLKSGGDTLVHGNIYASGPNGRGGDIDLVGARVGVMDGALVDASGPAGGGSIRIGGDLQGRNPGFPNARVTYIAPTASVRADATSNGDGGRIIVWSDNATRIYGGISARGGPHGGNGGFIETSGHYLDLQTTPDLRAPMGRRGTLLVDPTDLTISVNGPNANVTAGNPLEPVDPNLQSTMTVARLQGILDVTQDLVVQTTDPGGAGGNGDLIFDTSAGAGGSFTINRGAITSDSTLTLNAHRNVQFTGGGTVTFTTSAVQGLTVHMNPNVGGLPTAGRVLTDGGTTMRLTSGSGGTDGFVALALPAGKLWENRGNVILDANTRIELDETVTPARLENLASGIITVSAVDGIRSATSAGEFHNAGRVDWNTTGSLLAAYSSADGSTLALNGGANITLPNGKTMDGTIELGTSTMTISNGSALFSGTQINGTGTILVEDASGLNNPVATFANMNSLPTTTLTSGGRGSIVFSGDAVVGALASTTGNITQDASTTLRIDTSLTIGGGTTTINGSTELGASLTTVNGGTLTGNGVFDGANLTWNAGTIGGNQVSFTNVTTPAGAARTVNGNLIVNGTWANAGTVEIAGGGRITFHSTFDNNAGGVVRIGATSTDANPLGGSGGTFRNNAGATFEYQSTAATQQQLTTPVFENLGQVNIIGGGKVTLPAGSGASTGSFDVDSTTLVFNGARSLLGGADITGDGTVEFLSGNIAVANNNLTIFTNGNATFSGANVTFQGAAPIVFANALTLSGGTVSCAACTMTGNGTTTLSGPVTMTSFQNGGTVNQTGAGRLTLTGGNTSSNNNGGTWNVTGHDATPITGAGTFNNNGQMNFNGTFTRTLSPTQFNNGTTGVATGEFNVHDGVLLISNGGNHQAPFNVAANRTLDFSGGTQTFGANALIGGDGTARFSGNSNATFSGGGGLQNLDRLQVDGGTVNLTGTATVAGVDNLVLLGGALTLGTAANVTTTQVTGGTFTANAGLTTGQLSIHGGNVDINAASSVGANGLTLVGGAVRGNASLTLNGANNSWTGGGFDGTGSLVVAAPATLFISGNNLRTIAGGYTIDNAGTVVWTGTGNVEATGGANSIVNRNSWSLQNDSALTTSGAGTLVFSNQAGATLSKQGAGTTSTFSGAVDLHNLGAIRVNAGTLAIADGQSTGALTIAQDGTLAFNGAFAMNAGASFAGPGALRIDGGQFDVNAAMTIANPIVFAGGATLGGNGSLRTTGATTVNGVGNQVGLPWTIANTGSLSVSPNAGLNVIAGGLVTNEGTLVVQNGAVIDTNGTDLSSTGTVRGIGTLRVGTGAFRNNGSFLPGASPGTFLVDGNYVQGPAGNLIIDLAGTQQGATYDFVRVTGNAILDGTLTANPLNGYVGGAADRFEFMTFAARSGDFATYNPPAGWSLQPQPGATSYALAGPSALAAAAGRTLPIEEVQRLNENLAAVIESTDDRKAPQQAAGETCN